MKSVKYMKTHFWAEISCSKCLRTVILFSQLCFEVVNSKDIVQKLDVLPAEVFVSTFLWL